MPQLHKRYRCATLKNGFLDPRCFALLRTASLGMTTMGHPFREPGGMRTRPAMLAGCARRVARRVCMSLVVGPDRMGLVSMNRCGDCHGSSGRGGRIWAIRRSMYLTVPSMRPCFL